jgi:hypothetical protein
VAEHVVLGRIKAVTHGDLIKVHVRDDVESDDQSGGVHGGSSFWSFAGAGRGVVAPGPVGRRVPTPSP